MTAQAGNCRDHAEVAAFLHAAHLREGEEVYTVGSTTLDHAWAELRGQGSDGERHIAMDPWGKRPAIFAEDGAFSGIDHESRRAPYHYDHHTGARAQARMEELQQRRHHRMQSQLRREMKKLGPDYTRIAHVAADLRRFPLESHPAQFLRDES